MQPEQEIKDAASAIISFTDSYAQNMEGIQNEQQESEPTSSLIYIVSYLQQLQNQISDKNACKQMIKIPKLLKSLVALSLYKIGTHIDVNQQRLELRSWSRDFLVEIQCYADASVQTELVNKGYGRMLFISISTAGGIGEEQDQEIYNELNRISRFLRSLPEGRNYRQPSFQPLPLLARRSEEQMEEEGADEEIEAQMNNKRMNGIIKAWANYVKAATLNRFIHRRRI
ncbi:MAG: hypothetical protein EZS28_037414 [Streblomastix strix]|uniref:Uncharacterized protein n=1 Tax=Streblomastix strix TaxID=222440 RepID=A0A5J4U9E5_9EUKA|nr:MAG: hypothetical protein EZS28_037414 [Streblomastix strix]